MKTLIVGKKGQLATELLRGAPEGMNAKAFGSGEMDLRDQAAVDKTISSFRPEVILNAAAYTAVDKAESDLANAFALNRDGVHHLAKIAKKTGARLIHVSTDFVFDGTKSSPYLPDDPTAPLGVYGESKRAGEEVLLDVLADQATIVRTSWMYSAHGNNFVRTMLKLMQERDQLGVVSDQIGSPTWAHGLAELLWTLVASPASTGIWHWSDLGVASWYDFAVAIQEEALAKGMLLRSIPIRPRATKDYPTAAKRPAMSVLDITAVIQNTGLTGQHWREALRAMLAELKETMGA